MSHEHNEKDNLEAAQAVITAIRQAGAEIYLTPDSRIYATFIPPELYQALSILIPEVLIILEREGRKPLPSQGDIANRLLPDNLSPQRQALNRLAGFPNQQQPTPNNPVPVVSGSVSPNTTQPDHGTHVHGIVGTLLQLVAMLGVGITCLSLFLALAPVAIMAMALGAVDGVLGRRKP